MAHPLDWAANDTWNGGVYEIAIDLGEIDPARVDVAMAALWPAACAEPPVLRRDVAYESQTPAPLTFPALDERARAEGSTSSLRGWTKLPSGVRTVCVVTRIAELQGRVWLDFGLPLGALTRVDDRVGSFPYGRAGGPTSLGWRRPLDEWLAGLGRAVHATLPIEGAMIGFEVSGLDPTEPWGWARLVPQGGTLSYSAARG